MNELDLTNIQAIFCYRGIDWHIALSKPPRPQKKAPNLSEKTNRR